MKGGEQRDHVGDLVLWWEDGRAEVLSTLPLTEPEKSPVNQHRTAYNSTTI